MLTSRVKVLSMSRTVLLVLTSRIKVPNMSRTVLLVFTSKVKVLMQYEQDLCLQAG